MDLDKLSFYLFNDAYKSIETLSELVIWFLEESEAKVIEWLRRIR